MSFLKPIKQNKAPLSQLKLPALSALTIALMACGGGGSGDSTPTNKAPVAKQTTIEATSQTGNQQTINIDVTDPEGDALTYTVKTKPTKGKVTLDAKTGVATYAAGNIVGEDNFVVSVSDGKASTDVLVKVMLQTNALFDYQFYKVANPDTGNYQIVRFDPNDDNAETNQKVIKQDVILGDRVFVLAADKDGDKKIYKKREFAVFLDPSASYETRTSTNDKGETFEYRFYNNNILKRFSADNTSKEDLVFTSTMLGSNLGAQGLSAIGSDYKLYVNETDTAGSYVNLKAYGRLPDLIKGESSADIKSTFITVHLNDSAVVQGRTIKPIVDNTTGETQGVLINYHKVGMDGVNPAANSDGAMLKLCDAMLTACNELGDAGKGAFYFMAENTDYIYLTKAGDESFYAFKKADNSISKVTGATYPAKYDPVHHAIMRGLDHGGSGILSDFSSLTVTNYQLSEGADAYRLVNYNLDTKDGVWSFYGYPQYTHKNGMVVKFNGTTAMRIFDTGDGKDLKDESDAVAMNGQLNLVAVKDGNLFVELGKYDTDAETNVLSSGWITKTSYDGKAAPAKNLGTTVTTQNVRYFVAHQVPSVAVSDSVYVVEVPTDNGAGGKDDQKRRIYNVYKLPLTDTSKTKADITPVRGRMFFERTAARSSGIFEGSVLTWNIVNGEIRNATNNILVGTDTNDKTSNALAGNTGNMIGVGGMFGLHLSASHGGAYDLASGESATEGSLKIINKTNGSWIFD